MRRACGVPPAQGEGGPCQSTAFPPTAQYKIALETCNKNCRSMRNAGLMCQGSHRFTPSGAKFLAGPGAYFASKGCGTRATVEPVAQGKGSQE